MIAILAQGLRLGSLRKENVLNPIPLEPKLNRLTDFNESGTKRFKWESL